MSYQFSKPLGLWLAVALIAGVFSLPVQAGEPASGPEITVYKSPTCGCCTGWVDYLKDNNFRVTAHNVDNLDQIRAKHGLKDPKLRSCHTAIVDGYVVEGHVPVDDIKRLLTERPKVIGISAPGMPQMSPGMMSIEPKDYDVVSFDADGKVEVFSRY
ncbi:MAG: DUF411 domain-containing protein [Gammaproteobacteria bacterium]|nr:DUF411 domain-containing protein [Gammaproteobacteria bacterium]